jgi:hypothetical protein
MECKYTASKTKLRDATTILKWRGATDIRRKKELTSAVCRVSHSIQ